MLELRITKNQDLVFVNENVDVFFIIDILLEIVKISISARKEIVKKKNCRSK